MQVYVFVEDIQLLRICNIIQHNLYINLLRCINQHKYIRLQLEIHTTILLHMYKDILIILYQHHDTTTIAVFLLQHPTILRQIHNKDSIIFLRTMYKGIPTILLQILDTTIISILPRQIIITQFQLFHIIIQI